MTANEHDNPTTAHEPEDGAEHADASDGQFGEHLSSGTDPGASAYPSEYPHDTGLFPRLQPREFPHDEPPEDESSRDEAARDEAGGDEFPPEAASGRPDSGPASAGSALQPSSPAPSPD